MSAPRTAAEQFLAFIEARELQVPYVKGTQNAVPINTLGNYTPAEIDWVRASGYGTLSALAIYHRQYDEEFEPPYNVAIVTLREGPFLLSTVLEDATPLEIGMTVEAQFDADGRLVFARETNAA